MAMGAAIGFLSFIRYRKIEKEIDEDTFLPSPILTLMTALALLAIGMFLLVYLIHSL